MLKINSLLNPASEHDRYGFAHSVTPPSTPADSAHAYSPTSTLTSQPTTPLTPTPKRQKRAKDASNFTPGPARGPVNYPPFECNEPSVCLSNSQQRELEMQHRLFKVQPTGRDEEGGLISRNVHHIPYSSEKRGFMDKTGRGGFDVFKYFFVVSLLNPKTKVYEERRFPVMWDYQVGLVRITPFFKACKYTKTIPNKSLVANPGLKDLSHSVTGGSVEAQGYWVPYSCARALCLTFCYPIRWALTPVFGPSFIKECLAPDHPGYGRFKIDPEVIRISALEQQDWRVDTASRDATPAYPQAGREIPRSAPAAHEHVDHSKPQFKQGSPFSEASSDRNYVYSSPMTDSPALSPKSKHRPLMPVQSPTWTSINRSGYDSPMYSHRDSPPTPLSGPLQTNPNFSPNISWRNAEPALVQLPTNTRRISTCRSVVDAPPTDADYSPPVSVASSDRSSSDIQPPPAKKRKTSKSGKRKSSTRAKNLGGRTEWTEEDMNAARWLLRLHEQPRSFAGVGDGKSGGV
ncbi:hypothetical protein M409DRAFT_65032 [Zasmidium cellare ATCC 36951]|uniref:HTH APSES-type domain-containing protein n=1 Tax=Zasmidium cellare ATCC 36951 TaxID=1080233 RepID=A0A6A6CT43_ZASCE|nr:uncharacterized protein M409DRAFT_65032 [Zasmidium cellare ATCC 36951]KAF2169330.1 hypothetical protein M409DRAFT_65032 [Zasmidium cellare ATCC 36951]